MRIQTFTNQVPRLVSQKSAIRQVMRRVHFLEQEPFLNLRHVCEEEQAAMWNRGFTRHNEREKEKIKLMIGQLRLSTFNKKNFKIVTNFYILKIKRKTLIIS